MKKKKIRMKASEIFIMHLFKLKRADCMNQNVFCHRRRIALIVSPALWVIGGLILLIKGVSLIRGAAQEDLVLPCIALALIGGHFKGKFVLSRTAKRIGDHIRALPEPFVWYRAYPVSYLILLASMVGLSFLIRLLPPLAHGAIDLAVGTALVGGCTAFRRPKNPSRTSA
jgi:hypothetical protein